MTTIELLEESLKQLKIIQLDNLRREPDHCKGNFITLHLVQEEHQHA